MSGRPRKTQKSVAAIVAASQKTIASEEGQTRIDGNSEQPQPGAHVRSILSGVTRVRIEGDTLKTATGSKAKGANVDMTSRSRPEFTATELRRE